MAQGPGVETPRVLVFFSVSPHSDTVCPGRVICCFTGPTSNTGMEGQTSTVSAMDEATFISVRKCCPRNFFGFTTFIEYSK